MTTTTSSIEKIELRGSQISKTIKELLKKTYPNTKFSVRYRSFAGGDSVDVTYQYGPPRKEVEALLKGYQQGRFNGMEDIYEYHGQRIIQTVDGERLLDGGIKYLDVTNEFPDELDIIELKNQINHGVFSEHNDLFSFIRRAYNDFDFRTSEVDPKSFSLYLKPNMEFRLSEDMIGINFKTIEKEPVEEGKLEILNYSEYSIAVFGTNYSHAVTLKQAGGRYNRFLTHPETGAKSPGWIFKKSQFEAVRNLLKIA